MYSLCRSRPRLNWPELGWIWPGLVHPVPTYYAPGLRELGLCATWLCEARAGPIWAWLVRRGLRLGMGESLAVMFGQSGG